FIARTRRDRDRAGWIALGLPLPPSLGKKRIALEAEPSLVQAIEPPPLLRDVIDILPTRWQERIETLCANLTPHTASVRVVGSLAWQYLAGTAYLHPQSDIDVVLRVTDFSKVGTL